MPRYFFILAYPDQEIGDPRGVIVPSDEAAIEAGRVREGRPFRGNYRLVFDKSSHTYLAPKNMPDEIK